MNALRPLLYLTFRSFLNGIRRGLTTPRRLIGTIVLLGYYFFFFMRPSLGASSRIPSDVAGRLTLPPLEVIDGLVFGVMTFLSVFMLLGVTTANMNYKPADVDILFPTPIPPRIVLLFRMVRDYLIIIIIPIFITLIGIKPAKIGWETVFRDMPQYGGLTLRFMMLSWLLIALGWISISYAVSLYVNRSDRNSTRNRRIMGWTVSTLLIGIVAYISFHIRGVESPTELLAFSRDPILRVFFFMATFATEFTLSPFSETMARNMIIGLGGLMVVPVVGIILALKQVEWLYDQAAVKAVATQSATNMRKAGDMSGIAAEAARAGKRHLKLDFLQRVRWHGPMALIWKELVLQPRTMLWMSVGFTIMGVMMTVMPVVFPDTDEKAPLGYVMLIMQGITVFTVSMAMSQTGYVEVLRRVDLQKPLPFKPSTTVWCEVLSKALLSFIPAAIGALILLVLRPHLWAYIFAAFIATPSLAVLMCASVFLVMMLFPDVDDNSQRQFRGMMAMLAVIITGVFPLGAFIAMAALHVPPYLGAAVFAVISLGIATFVTWISGQLYASFNPSE